ncbi:MAG: LuxR C-terminal-related transcriptional regulator [Fuerstiella sp.]
MPAVDELLASLAAQSTDAWCVVQNSPFEVTLCSLTLQKQLKELSPRSDSTPEEATLLLQAEIQTICAQVTSQFRSGDCLLLDSPVGPYNQARVTTLQLSPDNRGFLMYFLERTEVSPVDEIASRIKALSRRQSEILVGLYGGETNKSMSIRMGISEKTVEKHRAKVMENMKASTAAELIRMITIAQMSGVSTQLDGELPGLDCPNSD